MIKTIIPRYLYGSEREDMMMQAPRMLLPATFFLAAQSFPALGVSIHKCEDEQGNITYQDRCPPGTTVVESKNYRVKNDDDNTSGQATGPVTLYLVPDCESCIQVEEFLAARGIPVNRKDVKDNLELQEELKAAAGELSVPALVINDNVVMGYDRNTLTNALSNAGYQTELKAGN